MGYDLSIVRQKDWENTQEESNITVEEWLAYVKSDNELSPSDEPNFFDWRAYVHKEENGTPWFQYCKGYITTKNPDLFVIKKMLAIAEFLKGKVQGEEGEFYDESFLEALL